MTPQELAVLSEHLNFALTRTADLPSLPVLSAEEIQARVEGTFCFEQPTSLEALIPKVSELLRDGIVHTPSPIYFGLFNPAVTEAAVAGDALAAAYNPQLAAYSHAPAVQEIERLTLRSLADRMGLPMGTVGHFTSGGSEANHTAVLLALTRAFPNFDEEGAGSLAGQARLYVSEIAHDSFSKIAHACGIGRRAVAKVPVDGDLRLDGRMLREMIARDREDGMLPFLVVGTAGTTSAGAIDPLSEIALIAREEGLWFHADAAWGGGALLSPQRHALFAGIERADSVTCDAHKWLSVPMGAGMFFTRHADVQAATFRVSAGYMPARSDHGIDPFLSTMQWSRRTIGLKVAVSLANLGWAGYEEMVERMFSLAGELRERLLAAGWVIRNTSLLPLVCFSHPTIESGETTFEQVLAGIYAENAVWISIAPLACGARALRACITSLHTRSEDLETLVAVCERAISR